MTGAGPALVYLLCLLTSAVATALLARAWRQGGNRLLLWTAICFGLLAINNGLLVTDRLIFPEGVDLRMWRQFTSLSAVGVLLFGLIWEAE